MSASEDKAAAAREGKRRNLGRGLNALLGSDSGGEPEDRGRWPRMVPVEAIEHGGGGEAMIRVRFSAGVCGDVAVPEDLRHRRQ